jgi:transposase-like protein
VDEAYVGGKRRLNKGGRAGHPGEDSNKSPVVALIERNGRVRATPMPRVTQENLAAVIFGDVDLDSTMMTDEHKAYPAIGRQMKRHGMIEHGTKVYVTRTPSKDSSRCSSAASPARITMSDADTLDATWTSSASATARARSATASTRRLSLLVQRESG